MPERDRGNHQQDSRDGHPQLPQQGRMKRIRPIGAGKAFAIGLLAALIVSGLMAGVLILYANNRDSQASDETKQAILDQRQYVNEELAKFGLSASESALAKAQKSAVNLTVSYSLSSSQPQDASIATPQPETVPQDVPAQPAQPAPAAQVSTRQISPANSVNGSGIVIQQTDTVVYVLTNYHVISGAKEIIATIQGVDYVATPVGTGDASSDIAVLKIEGVGEKMEVASRGASSDVAQGDWVMTIGNPHGFHDSMSSGVISATGRNIPSNSAGLSADVLYANMIQTDIALNPGNSGGGLWDIHGNLIGMTTLIWSMDGGNEGIGFAIPSDYALRIAENLINGEAPSHAAIGASLDAIPDSVVSAYGLHSQAGAYITSIVKAGAAENASLAQGDIITSIDGKPVKTVEDVLLIVRGHTPNDKVEVKVLRQGMEMDFSMFLGSDA